MKIRNKLLLAFLLVSFIPLTIVSAFSYFSNKNSLTDEVINHLNTVVKMQTHRVESVVEQNIERLALVSSRTQLRISLSSFIDNPNADERGRMNSILLDARSSIASFVDISIVTLDGKVAASTNEAEIGADYSGNELFIRGQAENNADTFVLDEGDNLCMCMSGPLYLDGELLGVALIESTADTIIFAIQDYEGLGETGETLLAVLDENGDAMLLAPTRFDENAALKMTVSGEKLDSPVVQAVLGQERVFEDTVDYRGERVMAVTEYISGAGWGLVSKIDRTEALAPINQLQYLSFGTMITWVVLIACVSFYLTWIISRPIVRLSQLAARVSAGDINARAEEASSDEIGALAKALNQMKDNLVKTSFNLEKELDERKRTEDKYSILVEQSNDGIIILQDTVIKFANTKMVEMSGFSLKETIRKPFFDFISPEFRELTRERYLRRISGESAPDSYEIEIIRKDGVYVPVEINVSLIEYEGRPADMVVAHDITERKRSEKVLRESEERYRDLFDNTNDMIQSIAPDGGILYVNKSWLRVLGYKKEEVAGMKIWDVIHPDSMKHCEQVFKRVMEGEKTGSIEAVFVAKDGRLVDVEGNSHCRRIKGRPGNTQGIFRDVTERKQAEEHITHLNSVLRALRNVNQLITHESDRERLIQQSCNMLVNERGYEKTWILLLDEKGKPVSVASAGIGEESSAFIERMKSGKYPACLKELLAQGEPFLAYDNPGISHKKCILSERHRDCSVYSYRLEYGGKVYGAMGVTLPPSVVSDEEERGLFIELAGDVSFALDAIERQEESQRAQEEISKLARFPSENPSPVLRVAGDGNIMYANKASLPLLKKWKSKAGGVLDRHWLDYVMEALDSGEVKSVETGCEDWVFLLHFAPVTEAGYVNIYGTDITGRKQAENALMQSEERYRSTLDGMLEGCQIIDYNWRYIYVNDVVAKHGRQSKENLLGHTMMEVYPGIEKTEFFAKMRQCMEKRTSDWVENPFTYPDGSESWFELSIEPVPEGLFILSLDITERRKAEDALKESESRYRRLFESAKDGILIIDAETGFIIDANPFVIGLLGSVEGGLLGRELWNLGVFKDIAKNKAKFNELRRKGYTHYEDLPLKTADGRQRAVEFVSNVYTVNHRKIIQCNIRDITERKEAEEGLRQAYNIINRSRMVAFVWRNEENWPVDFVSSNVEDLFGYTAKEFLSGEISYSDMIHPDDRERVGAEVVDASRDASKTRFEHEPYRIMTRDGKKIWISDKTEIQRDKKGRIIHYQGIVENITEKRQMQEAIENELIRRRILVEGSRDGIVILEQGGRVYEANRRFCEMLGYTGEEIKKLHVWDWECHKSREELVEEFKNVDASGDYFETQHRRKDGTVYDVEISTNAAVFSRQKLIFCVCRDITERKRMEEAIKASEEKLRLMFESITDGITMTNLEGDIVQLNEATLRLHGYDSKEELIGRNSMELIAEKDHARAARVMERIIQDGSVENTEYTFVTRDGREFPAELSAAVIKDALEKPIGFIAVTKDITQRKLMEEQLLLTDRLASIGELASGIAHELNNPLTGVIGLTQLLIEGDAPANIKDDLKIVYNEAQRAAVVVKNLLAFARKHPPEKRLLDVNDVVKKVLELRAYEQKLNNIQVIDNMAQNLPKVTADFFQLQQVFLNIVINAEYFIMKKNTSGTLTITTEGTDDTVKISFADDGPGIPKENVGHIFDPFFTTKEVGKGTGLGLSICHGIIVAHNGKIYAESEPGKGATFIVELPVSREGAFDEKW